MKPIRLLIRLVIVMLALSPGMASAAPDLLARIVAQLSEPALIRADFVQEKRLAVLTRPLISHGRITVARGNGIIWILEAPIRMSIAFGADHIVEINAQGRRRIRGTAENRAQAEVGRIFKGLLAADMDSLRRYFDIEAGGDIQNWRINLKPRNPEVARFIGGVQLAGRQRIDEIQVNEAGGDTTLIRLRHTEVPAPLTPEEIALLAAP